MRFVEHHRRIFRQNTAEIILLQRQIREKQMMIHDDQVGILRPLVHRGHKTLVKLRAFLSRAGVPPRIQSRPQIRIIRQKRKLRAIARLRQLRPIPNLPERIDLFQTLEHRRVGHLVRLHATQKIRPPLHYRDFQFRRKMLLQKRNIFLIELFLQRLRRRRNHHTPPAANRRQQIRQRFPRAGSRLDNGMVLRHERVMHHFGHFQLRRAMLVPADHGAFQQPARPKYIAHLRPRRLARRPRRIVARLDLRFCGAAISGCVR